MKMFLVYSHNYDDSDWHGVFSTREKAIEAYKSLEKEDPNWFNCMDIYEVEIDQRYNGANDENPTIVNQP